MGMLKKKKKKKRKKKRKRKRRKRKRKKEKDKDFTQLSGKYRIRPDFLKVGSKGQRIEN